MVTFRRRYTYYRNRSPVTLHLQMRVTAIFWRGTRRGDMSDCRDLRYFPAFDNMMRRTLICLKKVATVVSLPQEIYILFFVFGNVVHFTIV